MLLFWNLNNPLMKFPKDKPGIHHNYRNRIYGKMETSNTLIICSYYSIDRVGNTLYESNSLYKLWSNTST